MKRKINTINNKQIKKKHNLIIYKKKKEKWKIPRKNKMKNQNGKCSFSFMLFILQDVLSWSLSNGDGCSSENGEKPQRERKMVKNTKKKSESERAREAQGIV